MYAAPSHSLSVELTLLSSRGAYAVRSKMESAHSAGATAHALQNYFTDGLSSRGRVRAQAFVIIQMPRKSDR